MSIRSDLMLISGLANAGKGLIFLLLPVLCSRGHMPVASMIRLSRVEFTRTDLSRLRAAIRLPQGLELQLGNSKLRVSVKVGGGEPATREFSLAEIRSDQHAFAPASQREGDARVRVFAISAGDLPRAEAFRAELLARQQASGRSGGNVSISILPDGCRVGDWPDGPVRITTYLQTAETGGFVVLAQDLDLRAIAGAHSLTRIPSCA
jgi:hypothetical protein